MRFIVGLLVAIMVASCPGTVMAETRIALVIGNGNYADSHLKLANPTNDALTMQRTLQAAGFTVIVKLNAKRLDFYHLVQDFADRIGHDPETVGLFYYAGHGVQANGENYLIPVDADIKSDAELEAAAYPAGRILRAMKDAQNDMNIVILDACRDNPLPKTTRGIERGLARMDAPSGTFIAYAAGPGQSAHDGAEGANGVFTGQLVKAMALPGVPLEQMFKRVIAGVRADTHGEQQPWSEASLQGDFYFHPGTPVTAAAVLAPSAGAAAPATAAASRPAAAPAADPPPVRQRTASAAALPDADAPTSTNDAPKLYFGGAWIQGIKTSAKPVGSAHFSPQAPDAQVAVFNSPEAVKQPFTELALLTHSDPCKALVSRTCTLSDAIGPLSAKAREVGADAIIIDRIQSVKTSLLTTGITVSGRAVRLGSP
jgi:uncharacterized caspase-like protein